MSNPAQNETAHDERGEPVRYEPEEAGGGGKEDFEPVAVGGWEYTNFAHDDDRYQYNGVGSDGEPEFVDFGPKGSR